VAAPGMPAVRELLDEWLPGSSRALDDFWQAVADGSLRLGETAATALEPAITPVRAGLQLLPDLPLREVVDSVAEGMLKVVRSAADAAVARFAPMWQGAAPSPEEAKPGEPPATEERDLPPARPSDEPRGELPRDSSGAQAA